MLFTEFNGMKVLDSKAKEIGKVSDIEFDIENATVGSIVVSLNQDILSGLFSPSKTFNFSFDEIATIGDYLLLSCELPEEIVEEEEEAEEEVKKVEVVDE